MHINLKPKKKRVFSILTTFALVAGGAVLTATPATAAPLTGCASATASCGWDLSTVEVAPAAGKKMWLKFVAPYTGKYVFESTNFAAGGDPYGEVYSSASKRLAYNNDGGVGKNFKISTTLTAGATYYMVASHSGSKQTGAYTIMGTVTEGIAVTPASWAPNYEAQATGIAVATANNASWKATSSASWLKLSAASGVGAAMVQASVTENLASARSAKITFTVGKTSQVVTVTQGAAAIFVAPDYWFTDWAGGTQPFTVTTSNNASWKASSSASWLKLSATSGASGRGFNGTVAANTGAEREATITVTAGKEKLLVNVVQASRGTICFSFAAACDWDLSPHVVDVALNTRYFLKFTADINGTHDFDSYDIGLDAGHVHGELFNSAGQRIAYDTDGLDGFEFSADLTAGETYYLVVWRTDDSANKTTKCSEKKAKEQAAKLAKKCAKYGGKYCVTTGGTSGDTTFTVVGFAPQPIVKLTQYRWYPDWAQQSLIVGLTTNYDSWTVDASDPWISVTPTAGTGTYSEITITVSEFYVAEGYNRDGFVRFTVTDAFGGTDWVDLSIQQTSDWWPMCTTKGTSCDWNLAPQGVWVDTGTDQWYYFVAPAADVVIESFDWDTGANPDPIAWLYDAAGNELAFDDDGAGNRNFYLQASGLTPGQTYYLLIRHADPIENYGYYFIRASW